MKDTMKELRNSVRLVVSEMDARSNGTQIAENRVQEIEEARGIVGAAQSLDVLTAVHEWMRAGIPLLIDLRPPVYATKEKSTPPPWRR